MAVDRSASRATPLTVAIPSPRARFGVRLRDLPAGAWLAAIVGLSTAIRFVLAITVPGPGIFPDELIYSELAKSIASSGQLLVRDVPFAGWTYGPLYALLMAPAFAIRSLPEAYLVAKALNCVLLSSAAVPAYLLARRLLDSRRALLVAGLALLVPSGALTARIMTESAFYPVFLFAVLAMVLVLEKPTVRRELATLALVGIGCLIRIQGLVLLPILVTGIVVQAWLDRRTEGEKGLRGVFTRLGRYRLTWLTLSAGAVSSLAVPAALGRFPAAPIWERVGYVLHQLAPLDVPRWFIYHAAELDLSLGVIPFAAFFLFVRAPFSPAGDRAPRAFAVVVSATLGWMLALVGVFAAQANIERIQERYVFYLAPLFFTALLAWVRDGKPRSGGVAVATVVFACALPLALPFDSVLNYHIYAGAPGLVPWLIVREAGGRLAVYGVVVAFGAWAAYLLLAEHRRRLSDLLLPVLLTLATGTLLAHSYFVAVSRAAIGTGVGGANKAWIDRAVGSRASVAVLWSARTPIDPLWVSESEFFNRSVGAVYYLWQPMKFDLPQTRVRLHGSKLVLPDGRPLRARYVLSDGPLVMGERVASHPDVGLTLYRVEGVVRLERRVQGPGPVQVQSK